MTQVTQRKIFSGSKIAKIKSHLHETSFLNDSEQEQVACVYATGSFGRLEASQHSDLDLFIASLPTASEQSPKAKRRLLSQLNEICLKAELVKTTQKENLPPFDGDGEYLRHYTGAELIRMLGRPEDDAQNTFTARLLLLLESQPLIGEDIYNAVIDDVIASYWRDYEDHKDDFIPVFLTNDILRLWRTLAVGYEAKTQPDPGYQKAKRREKNYKLRHSRVLTCFSTILRLISITQNAGTVSPRCMLDITRSTPIERLDQVKSDGSTPPKVVDEINKMERAYEQFLMTTDIDSNILRVKFLDNQFHKERKAEASNFGDSLFRAIMGFGTENKLVRHVIV